MRRLQDHRIFGVESFRIRLVPRHDAAAAMTAWDDHGRQVLVINIPDLPPEMPTGGQ